MNSRNLSYCIVISRPLSAHGPQEQGLRHGMIIAILNTAEPFQEDEIMSKRTISNQSLLELLRHKPSSRVFKQLEDLGEIPAVLPLLSWSFNEPFTRQAQEAVTAICKRAAPHRLLWLANALHCAHHPGLTSFWRDLTPYYWAHFEDDIVARARLCFAGLRSCHRNGYLREGAVKELERIENGDEIPWLLMRINDNVEPIRRRAEFAVRCRMVPAYAPHLTRWLPHVFHLESCLGKNHQQFMDHIRFWLAGHSRTLIKGLELNDYRTRRLCLDLLYQRKSGLDEVLSKAMADGCLTHRLQALAQAEKRGLADHFIWDLALKNGASVVRIRALHHLLKIRSEKAESALAEALMDRLPGVRFFARLHLQRSFGWTGFTAHYRQYLPTDRNGVALDGFAECGLSIDVDDVLPYLHSDNPSTRAGALGAVAQLAPERGLDHFQAALSSGNAQVFKQGIKALQDNPDFLFPAALGEALKHTASPIQAVQLIGLLEKTERWSRLTTLVGLWDREGKVGHLIRDHLQEWVFRGGVPWQSLKPEKTVKRRLVHLLQQGGSRASAILKHLELEED